MPPTIVSNPLLEPLVLSIQAAVRFFLDNLQNNSHEISHLTGVTHCYPFTYRLGREFQPEAMMLHPRLAMARLKGPLVRLLLWT